MRKIIYFILYIVFTLIKANGYALMFAGCKCMIANEHLTSEKYTGFAFSFLVAILIWDYMSKREKKRKAKKANEKNWPL